MKTIYKQSVNGKNVTATDAGEGQKFFTTAAPNLNGRYLVVWDYSDNSGQGKQYFDSYVDALQFATFQRDQLRFCEAKDAGLNDETADLVATGKMTLDAALGAMGVTAECDEMQDYADWEASQGGEDDATPPLEIIAAGGQAAYDYQQEKLNAIYGY